MTSRPRSAHRELTDFLVMALAVVFLARTFIGEPFGVPTGSMALSMLGSHKLIQCPECNKTFPVGSDECTGEPVVCLCPACGTKLDVAAAPVKAGGRIVVMKGPPTPLQRWDVAVFKFVDDPRKLYVKRIVGLPGERLRIRGGEIELWNEVEQRWRIARKPADLAKEIAIPVWEEEFQKKGAPEAWSASPPDSWLKENGAWMSTRPGELRFRRLSFDGKPLLIGDELGYNFGLSSTQADNADVYWNRASNPISNLHVSFSVEPSAERPRFDVELTSGGSIWTLRVGDSNWRFLKNGRSVDSWDAPAGRNFHLHFSHVDRSLAAWIDHRLVREWIDDGDCSGFPDAEDLEPIRIKIVHATTKITNLRVYRDIYYTQQVGTTDFLQTDAGRDLMGDVNEFKRFREARQRTTEFTVPAGAYFALGGNSARSHDGRHWKRSHFIDERMIVGKVLFKLGR